MDFSKMPKIHLHYHMDGSCSVDFVQKYMKKLGRDYTSAQLKDMLSAPVDCGSLAEYLEKFDLPIQCIQTAEDLYGMAKDVIMSAALENVKYAEVRFAPTYSMQEGLKTRDIIEKVIAGCEAAKDKTGTEYGIIVCAMRHLGNDTGIEMLKDVREFLGNGVVACDIAGDEKAVSNADMAEYMKFARKYDFPMTIHAGECGSAKNIRDAVELGARRIGHGIAMRGNADTIRLCREQKVGIELCPTSNLQTKAISSMDEYPFMEFYNAGLMLSVNTDNSTVSGTTCADEFSRLDRQFGLDDSMLWKIYKDSVEMSFATDDIKDSLLKEWSL